MLVPNSWPIQYAREDLTETWKDQLRWQIDLPSRSCSLNSCNQVAPQVSLQKSLYRELHSSREYKRNNIPKKEKRKKESRFQFLPKSHRNRNQNFTSFIRDLLRKYSNILRQTNKRMLFYSYEPQLWLLCKELCGIKSSLSLSSSSLLHPNRPSMEHEIYIN